MSQCRDLDIQGKIKMQILPSLAYLHLSHPSPKYFTLIVFESKAATSGRYYRSHWFHVWGYYCLALSIVTMN